MSTTRRNFLGTALGAAVVAGCTRSLPHYLVPPAVPADDAIPGIARHYRTVCRGCNAGCGATARVREGRAVKLEGSADHPISRGGLCPAGQASIESLYSPERLGAPLIAGGAATWEQADAALVAGLRHALDNKKRIVVLTRPEPGRLGALFGTWLAVLGEQPSQVATFAPMARPWLLEGQRRALGTDATCVRELSAARFVLSIGDDFIEEGSPVEDARGFAAQREAGGRSIYVGPRLSLTAASADEWIAVAPGSELLFTLALLGQVLELGVRPGVLAPALVEALRSRVAPYTPAAVAGRTGVGAAKIAELARSLVSASTSVCLGPGRSSAGDDAPALAEAIAVLNTVLGNNGKTLHFLPAPPAVPAMELAEFIRLASAGEVGALLVHHADPLGYGQAFAPLAAALKHVPFIAAFTNELDATARAANLVMADHHFLESWSDVPTREGVVGLQQPVMMPVLTTRPAADQLVAAARTLGKSAGLPDGAFGDALRAAFDAKEVERGGRFTPATELSVALSENALGNLPQPAGLRGPAGGLPLIVVPSLRQLDGKTARSELLREIPHPLSGYSWTGWVELHPSTAAALSLKSGDVVMLEGASGHVELPAFVTTGIRPGAAAVLVGDALALLAAPGALGLGSAVTARGTGEHLPPLHPEEGRSQYQRKLARSVTRSSPRLPVLPPQPSLYPAIEHPVHRWGMAIDLDRCNGCGACTAACYVENNLPIVGAAEVARGRAMSWLTVQAFVDEKPGGPAVSFLPLGCQHCTNAPCETVCPTFATYHTPEGLNAQVYARCIGTRYCENNCPYGVRRFNFLDFPRPSPSNLGLNPDVTVRERGVTEKCTLCVQRIREGEEQAKCDGRKVQDGDIVTACASACPAHAIVFGDLKDEASAVSRLAADGRSYRLLEELNTLPGVVYMARRREKA